MTKLFAFDSFTDGSQVTLLNSTGEGISSSDLPELLHWLKYSSTQGSLRITWDLDQFLAPLFRLMPLPLLKLIVANDNGASYDGDTIFYALHKMARFRQAYYYGIKEFWPSATLPPSSVQELQERADQLTEALDLLGMGDFQRIASPIAIFEQTELGRKTYAGIPRDYEIPKSCIGLLEYADRADRKEWISNYQVGHWDSLFDWDISACYSDQASRLSHLHDLEYWRSNQLGSREQGAYFGFVKGRLWVDPDHEYQHCSPIMVKDIDGTSKQGNPAGWIDGCFSLAEVRFTEDSGLGGFIMEDGYFAKIQNGVSPRFPFKDIMDYLYQHRGWTAMTESVVKAIGNQLVGKMIERLRWRGNTEGEIYNSVYHSLITTGGRVKVARFLLDNRVGKNELVCAQTDGVRITKDIQQPATNGMGKWRCNGVFPTLVASPNIILAGGKKPQHYTYEMVTSEIKAHPNQSYYGMTAPQRVTLGQAVEMGDVGRVGEMVDLPARLDLFRIQGQQNRGYKELPQTGRQLMSKAYGSEAVVLG